VGKGHVFHAYFCTYSDNGGIHICKYVLISEGISMSLGQRIVTYNKHRRFTVGSRQPMPRLSERRLLALSEEFDRAELPGWLGLTREYDCSRRSRKFNVWATIMEKREFFVL
jgi:hypothetical protein